MPAFGRMLLMLPALFVGWPVIVVMADELPEDTNTIESLTAEQARRLVETSGEFQFEFGGYGLRLNELKQLNAATAKVLAVYPGAWLQLDGLTSLDAATATALAEFRGPRLYLNGLTTLDAGTATALAEYNGTELSLDGLTTLDVVTAAALVEFKGTALYLDGLTTLDVATAKALAEFKGDYLLLDGLRTLDAAAAKALAEFKGDHLTLEGLTTLDAATATALVEFKGKRLSLGRLKTLDAVTAKVLAGSTAWDGRVGSLRTLDVATATALAKFAGELDFGFLVSPPVPSQFVEKHPFCKTTAAAHAAVLQGELHGLTTLDTETARALVEFRGQELSLCGLQRASFGAVRALRSRPGVSMPNHWYLLREQIAALVGTVVFLVMAAIVVWYSRRQRAAG